MLQSQFSERIVSPVRMHRYAAIRWRGQTASRASGSWSGQPQQDVRRTRMRDRREERREARGEERQEERATFGRGGDATRYQMRQKLVSIGDDFWIENDRGERVYKVDGKALRLRQTLLFESPQGQELAKIQEKMLRVRDTMAIEGPSGETLAVIKKALITPLRERWTVKVGEGPDLEIQGNILDH